MLAVRFVSVYDAVILVQCVRCCSCHFQELGSEVWRFDSVYDAGAWQ